MSPTCATCGKGLRCAACDGRRGGKSKSPKKIRAAVKNGRRARRKKG